MLGVYVGVVAHQLQGVRALYKVWYKATLSLQYGKTGSFRHRLFAIGTKSIGFLGGNSEKAFVDEL